MYTAAPGTIIVRILSREGLRGLTRGEVLSTGVEGIPAGAVVLYLPAFSLRVVRSGGVCVVFDTTFSVLGLDERDVPVRVAHDCIVGMEMPELMKDCGLCKQALYLLAQQTKQQIKQLQNRQKKAVRQIYGAPRTMHEKVKGTWINDFHDLKGEEQKRFAKMLEEDYGIKRVDPDLPIIPESR